MEVSRREALKTGGGAALLGMLDAAGLLSPADARAAEWNKAALGSKDMAGALKGLVAQNPPQGSGIVMTAPDMAENGAVVPVNVLSKIPNTESIAILIEHNPFPLAATFAIPAGT